jgi:hypothetical protein
MAWDPALLRKYNATGHFRLLNQVRSELKEQPIQRPLVTVRTASTYSASTRSASSRPALSRGDGGRGDGGGGRPQASSQGRRRSAQGPAMSAPAPVSHDPIVMVPVLTDAFPDDSFSC